MGLITIFNGPVSQIPKYWRLCDGEDGAPNLEDKFIIGAYSDTTRPVGTKSDTGEPHTHTTGSGGSSHTHDITSDMTIEHSHYHRIGSATSGNGFSTYEKNYYAYVTDVPDTIWKHDTSVSSASFLHTHAVSEVIPIPSYYTLAFIELTADMEYDFPIGTILMWAGLVADIPKGWAFCDGENGTPDLRDKFIRGAYSDSTRSIGSTGTGAHSHGSTASASHDHTTGSAGYHRHPRHTSSSDNYSFDSGGYYTDYSGSHSHSLSSGGSHSHTTSTQSNPGKPPYYTLAYIKKVS